MTNVWFIDDKQLVKKKPKYWIEISDAYTNKYYWRIKCINGRVKGVSNKYYQRRSLCLNDAKAFAKEVGLEIRL